MIFPLQRYLGFETGYSQWDIINYINRLVRTDWTKRFCVYIEIKIRKTMKELITLFYVSRDWEKDDRNWHFKDVNDFHVLTFTYKVEVTWIHPKPYTNDNWWLSVNYDVKHLFITTQCSMKKSFVSRTNVLFQCARTSMTQNSFQKLYNAKFLKCSNEHPKCSNEQIPKTSNISIPNKLSNEWASAWTSNGMLKQAPSCLNEQNNRAPCFWYRCYVIA